MKKILLAICFSFSVMLVSAQTPDHDQIKATINKMFDGMRTNDSTLVRSAFAKGAQLSTVRDAADGKSGTVTGGDRLTGFLTAVARPKTKEQQWDERLLSYNIQVDGNLASVWTPYKFYAGEKFSHCGANSFQMVKTTEGWKIVYLIDTQKKTGCE